MKYNCWGLDNMEKHFINLDMAMLGNHTCTEGYNVGVLISKAICGLILLLYQSVFKPAPNGLGKTCTLIFTTASLRMRTGFCYGYKVENKAKRFGND